MTGKERRTNRSRSEGPLRYEPGGLKKYLTHPSLEKQQLYIYIKCQVKVGVKRKAQPAHVTKTILERDKRTFGMLTEEHSKTTSMGAFY
jgi:hypothetical protein